MSTNKVRIDATAGVVEVEGDKDFVEEQVDKILPLIQSAGFGGQHKAKSNSEPEQPELQDHDSNQERTAKKKRRGAPPPKGQSCRDRINSLKADGFFKEHRTPSDIKAGLAKKGWTHNNNQVGAALTQMFEKGEIQRTNDGSGFRYYWDRD